MLNSDKYQVFSQIFGGPLFLGIARPHWPGDKASNLSSPSDAALQILLSHFKPCSKLPARPCPPSQTLLHG